MRFLYVGDVVGSPGRAAVHHWIPILRRRLRLDVVVVNCENAAAGRGVTPALADEFLRKGVDVLTSGNHIWHFKQIGGYMEGEPRLIRPANYPSAPGRGAYRCKLKDGRVLGIIQVEGRVFMRNLECPFATATREIDRLGSVTAILVDIHAEATSEKQALAWHLDGRVAAVLGTHTHVPTADERILPGGTALQTDVGMTGPYDSVIGMSADAAVARFLTQRLGSHEVATDNTWLCGAVVETDDATGRAVSIERVKEAWPPPPTPKA
jgi:hypothetical protein